MSGFPPSKWEVRFLKDMHSLACQANEDGEITMAAYMAVKPSGGEEGTYRFALNGPNKIKLRFAVSDLLPGDLFTRWPSGTKFSWSATQCALPGST